MKDRTGNPAGRKPRLAVVGQDDIAGAVRAAFADQGQVLLPMLELVENARASIDELMSEAARGFVEQLLVLSAQEVAGAKHPGRRMGEVLWHGSQPGRVVLAERKLALKRPRLRSRAARGKEVAIPVYERLQAEPRLGERIRDILVRGVSTRKYAEVLPRMAGTVGIAKSSVSRRFIRASRDALEALMGRRFDEVDILAVWIDGIIVDDHHILAAVGVDAEGSKHLLGLAQGSSENAQVAKDLLSSLVERGIGPDRVRLFVIDGSKALRSAIEELFGDQAKVQRCRIHKMRNVTERLPKPIAAQVRAVMHAAYKLAEKDGIAKLKQQADLAQDRVRRRRGEPARGAGGDLHRQSAEAHALADALPGEHQRHRESERCGASRDPSGEPLPRRRDGAALDGDRIPGSGEVVPQDPGSSPALGARHCTRAIGRGG